MEKHELALHSCACAPISTIKTKIETPEDFKELRKMNIHFFTAPIMIIVIEILSEEARICL